MKKILLLVYIVIGVVVAASKDYLGDVGSIGDVLNLLLAILLWPLVLLGVDFNLKIGGGDDKNGGDKKKGALTAVAPALTWARAFCSKVTSPSKTHKHPN